MKDSFEYLHFILGFAGATIAQREAIEAKIKSFHDALLLEYDLDGDMTKEYFEK